MASDPAPIFAWPGQGPGVRPITIGSAAAPPRGGSVEQIDGPAAESAPQEVAALAEEPKPDKPDKADMEPKGQEAKAEKAAEAPQAEPPGQAKKAEEPQAEACLTAATGCARVRGD